MIKYNYFDIYIFASYAIIWNKDINIKIKQHLKYILFLKPFIKNLSWIKLIKLNFYGHGIKWSKNWNLKYDEVWISNEERMQRPRGAKVTHVMATRHSFLHSAHLNKHARRLFYMTRGLSEQTSYKIDAVVPWPPCWICRGDTYEVF